MAYELDGVKCDTLNELLALRRSVALTGVSRDASRSARKPKRQAQCDGQAEGQQGVWQCILLKGHSGSCSVGC